MPMEQPGRIPVPGSLVSRSAVTAATPAYTPPPPPQERGKSPSPQPGRTPIPGSLVSPSAVTAATLVYSAPTPGCGSRYVDGRVAHEARILSASGAGQA